MRRFPSFKIGLASFLSCLAIMLGMFTTTGTASAHSQTPLHRPIINVTDVHRFGNCISFTIFGSDFSPRHHAELAAEAGNGEQDASIDPSRVRINSDGEFVTDVTACTHFEFENCGEFIDNPFSFCGVNFGPNEFCQFEPQFGPCGPQQPVCIPQPPTFFCPPQPPPGVFNPLSVTQFCQFHNFSFQFCFIHRNHRLSFFIKALDEHSGKKSNSVFISIGI